MLELISWSSNHNDVIKWKHFYAFLAICAGNSPVPGEFPAQRPVTRSFNVFSDLRLNKRLWWTGIEGKNTQVQPLQWRHNEHDGVSIHRRLDCLLNRMFRCISKKTSKRRVTGLCEGNSPVTGEFPAQKPSNAENVFIWWHHPVYKSIQC